MKIIKKGVLPDDVELEKTCSRCNTEFSYNNKDIHADNRDGNYVICPVCKTFINVEHNIGYKTRDL